MKQNWFVNRKSLTNHSSCRKIIEDHWIKPVFWIGLTWYFRSFQLKIQQKLHNFHKDFEEQNIFYKNFKMKKFRGKNKKISRVSQFLFPQGMKNSCITYRGNRLGPEHLRLRGESVGMELLSNGGRLAVARAPTEAVHATATGGSRRGAARVPSIAGVVLRKRRSIGSGVIVCKNTRSTTTDFIARLVKKSQIIITLFSFYRAGSKLVLDKTSASNYPSALHGESVSTDTLNVRLRF